MIHYHKRFLLASLLAISATMTYAHIGRIVDEVGNPIENAKIVIARNDSVVTTCVSDFEGKFSTSYGGGGYQVTVTAPGYEKAEITTKGFNIGNIILEKSAQTLAEITVSPQKYIESFDHRTYILSQKQMERYSTFLGALVEIPHITMDDGLRYMGLQGVKLLINGIESNESEVAALSKDDIKDIEVFDVPPARFSDGNTTCVINIRTKRNITGGNTFLSLSETVNPWFVSRNSVSSIYNFGKNRVSVSYNDQFTHTDGSYTDSEIKYFTENQTITKIKNGVSTPHRYNEHNFNTSYLFSDPQEKKESTQFNASFGGTFTSNRSHDLSNVTDSDGMGYMSAAPQHTNLSSLNLNLYFHRTFKRKHFLIANIVGTTYDTSDETSYTEWIPDTKENLFSSNSKTDGRIYSIIGDLHYIYRMPFRNEIEVSGKYYWQHAQQTTEGIRSLLLRNEAQFAASYSQRVGRVFFLAKLQGDYLNSDYEHGVRTESSFHFTPMLYASWQASEKVRMLFRYMRRSVSPTASQLTQQVQVIDNGLKRTGNPDLRSYSDNSFLISQSLDLGKFQYSINLYANITPGQILPVYSKDVDFVLESLANADKSANILAQLSLRYSPLPGLIFSGNGMLGKKFMRVSGNSWNIPTYRFNIGATYNLPKWEFFINYQFPGHDAFGVQKRVRIQSLSFGGAFKPQENMSIGLSISNPWMKAKEEIISADSSIIYVRNINYIDSFKNAISLNFSWNIQYGKRKVEDNTNLYNYDSDSGLL